MSEKVVIRVQDLLKTWNLPNEAIKEVMPLLEQNPNIEVRYVQGFHFAIFEEREMEYLVPKLSAILGQYEKAKETKLLSEGVLLQLTSPSSGGETIQISISPETGKVLLSDPYTGGQWEWDDPQTEVQDIWANVWANLAKEVKKPINALAFPISVREGREIEACAKFAEVLKEKQAEDITIYIWRGGCPEGQVYLIANSAMAVDHFIKDNYEELRKFSPKRQEGRAEFVDDFLKYAGKWEEAHPERGKWEPAVGEYVIASERFVGQIVSVKNGRVELETYGMLPNMALMKEIFKRALESGADEGTAMKKAHEEAGLIRQPSPLRMRMDVSEIQPYPTTATAERAQKAEYVSIPKYCSECGGKMAYDFKTDMFHCRSCGVSVTLAEYNETMGREAPDRKRRSERHQEWLSWWFSQETSKKFPEKVKYI